MAKDCRFILTGVCRTTSEAGSVERVTKGGKELRDASGLGAHGSGRLRKRPKESASRTHQPPFPKSIRNPHKGRKKVKNKMF